MAGLGSAGRQANQRQTFFLDVNRHLASQASGPRQLAASGRRPDDSQRKYKTKNSPVQHQDIPPMPIAKKKPLSSKAHALMYTGATGPSKPTVAKELFQQLDTNKDGTITYAEFSRGLSRHVVQEKLSNYALGTASGYSPDSGNLPLRKNDPLNLKEPPKSIVQQFITDAEDYGIGGLDPDSLAADVEVLRMQKQLLSAEAQWWNDVAQNESALRLGLQEDLQAQEQALNLEAADTQRQIEKSKEELNYYETRTRDLSKETRDFLAEANAAQAEMEAMRKMLVTNGVPETQLRAALSKSQSTRSAQRPRNGIRSQLRKDEFDDDEDVEELLGNPALKGARAALGDTIDLGRLGFA